MTMENVDSEDEEVKYLSPKVWLTYQILKAMRKYTSLFNTLAIKCPMCTIGNMRRYGTDRQWLPPILKELVHKGQYDTCSKGETKSTKINPQI